jgi:hypothetical protein
MNAPSNSDVDEVPVETRFSSLAQRLAFALGVGAAALTILSSALFTYWMAVLAKTYIDEVGGGCGTVVGAIQVQLMMLGPWCLLVIYVTASVSSRVGVAPTLTHRFFQAAVTCWVSLFLGMLIGGL